MSEFVQTDAKGNPQVFTDAGRAKTEAVTISDEQHAVENGAVWNLTSTQITLTDDNPTVIRYVSNETYEGNLIIPLYILLAEPSTGGSGVMQVELVRNPLTGDIITNANSGEAVHQNFGGTKSFPGHNYKGATSEGDVAGNAATNSVMRSRMSADNRLLLGIITYLPQGTAVAVRVTPPSGNTSMVVESAIEAYEEAN